VLDHGAQVLEVEQQQALVVGDLEHQLQHAALGFVQVEQAGEEQRAHVGHRRADRHAALAEDIPEGDRVGVGLEAFEAEILEPRFQLFGVTTPAAPMPERSPLTSAMNTGTPAKDRRSAIDCRVTVLPVPVAPVIRPWRLAICGSRAG
jgi:hypothetical protein